MLKTNYKIYINAVFGCFLFTNHVVAQVQEIDKNASGFAITTEAIATDNFNPTVDDETSAFGAMIKPEGELVTTGEGYQLAVDYMGRLEGYQIKQNQLEESEKQNFVSYSAGLRAKFFLSDSWSLGTTLRHAKEQQKYGFGLSKLRRNVLVSDELTQNNAAVSLVYGSDTSNRMIAFEVAGNDVQYADNNDYAGLFSYSQSSLRLNMAFRQSSASRWLARLEVSDDDFDSELRSDSRVYRGLFGLDWKITGKSSFELLLGAYRRDVIDKAANSGASWLLNYEYKPREDFVIHLSSSRQSVVGESELADDSLKSDTKLAVSYAFSQQWQFGLTLAASKTEFEEILDSRELEEQSGALRVGLSLSSHSNIDVILANRALLSSDNAVDYSQNEVRLSWHYEF